MYKKLKKPHLEYGLPTIGKKTGYGTEWIYNNVYGTQGTELWVDLGQAWTLLLGAQQTRK